MQSSCERTARGPCGPRCRLPTTGRALSPTSSVGTPPQPLASSSGPWWSRARPGFRPSQRPWPGILPGRGFFFFLPRPLFFCVMCTVNNPVPRNRKMSDLTDLELIAFRRAIRSDGNANTPATIADGESVTVDYVAHVRGTLSRGNAPANGRKGTSRLLARETVLLVLHCSGATRDNAAAAITTLWATLGGLSKADAAAHVASMTREERARYDAVAVLFDEMVADVPRIPIDKGSLRFDGDVSRWPAGVLPSSGICDNGAAFSDDSLRRSWQRRALRGTLPPPTPRSKSHRAP